MADAGQLVVHIKADTSQFHSELGRAQGEISKTGSMFAQMGAVAGGMLAAQGIARLADGLGSLVGAGIQFNSTMQQATMAFETMLKSSSLATEHISELRDFAKQTAFSFSDLTKQSVHLQAYGFAAKEVVPILKTVSDAVSALGGGSATIDRITRAMGQMSARGKIGAQDMMQLTEAGVKAWDYIAKATGKSVGEIQKLSESGALEAREGIAAILAGMDEEFGGLGAKYATSWAGIVNNLGDVWEQLAGSVMAPAFERIGSMLGRLLENLSTPEFAMAAADLGASIGYAFDAIVQGAQNLGGLIQGSLEGLGDTFGGAASSAFEWGSNIVVQLAAGIIDAAGAALSAAMGAVSSMLSFWLAPGSPPKVAPDLDLWGAQAFTEYIKGFSNADFGVLDSVTSSLKSVLEGLRLQGEIGGDQALIPSILLGSREQIAQMMGSIRDTGQVSREMIDSVASTYGSASGAVAEYLSAQMSLIPVSEELARAQGRMNDLLKEEQGIRRANDKVSAQFERERIGLEMRQPGKDDKEGTKRWQAESDALAKRERMWRNQQRLAELDRKDAQDAAKDTVDGLKAQEDQLKKNADAQAGLLKAVEQTAKLYESMIAKAGGGGGGGGGIKVPSPPPKITGAAGLGKAFTFTEETIAREQGTFKGAEERVSPLKKAMDELGSKMQTSLAPANDALKRFQVTMDDLQPTFDRVGAAAGVVGTAIGGIALAFGNAGGYLATAGAALGTFGETLGKLTIVQYIGEVVRKLGDDLSGFASRITPLLGPAGETIGRFFGFLGQAMAPGITIALAGIGIAFEGLLRIIGGVTEIVWTTLTGIVEVGAAVLAAFQTGNWAAVGTAVENMAKGWVSGMYEMLNGAVFAFVGVGAAIAGAVIAWAGPLAVAAQQAWDAVTLTVGTWTLTLAAAITAKATVVAGAIGSWLTDVVAAAQKIFDGVVGVFANIGTTIKDTLVKAFNGAVDAINGGLDKIRGISIPSVTVGDKTIGGGSPFAGLPVIPRIAFAEGGIVTQPTNALIGEAGPEAVIPLSGSGGAGLVETMRELLLSLGELAPAIAAETSVGKALLEGVRALKGSVDSGAQAVKTMVSQPGYPLPGKYPGGTIIGREQFQQENQGELGTYYTDEWRAIFKETGGATDNFATAVKDSGNNLAINLAGSTTTVTDALANMDSSTKIAAENIGALAEMASIAASAWAAIQSFGGGGAGPSSSGNRPVIDIRTPGEAQTSWQAYQNPSGDWGGAGGYTPGELADGGIVTRPGVFQVGEAGPEAVIPLSQMGNGGGGGQMINITIKLDPPQVARMLRGELIELQRLGGRA